MSSKFMAGGLRMGSSAVVKALEASLDRLGVGYVDVYQIGNSG
eukprot:CAMPEP_0185772630 /NCGR_PEP_ID=MMETSP1174-20130828/69965_1 /TAXON_ID=35687 /ORGANISM="Dictyocha speculum, Strain CCMP1381" /LENGTH=42 /DNA_ID= /DNA_START= /DNA_END= /DNA_ORIENTATION=